MTDLDRFLATLEIEQWGRLGGRDRFSVICFPNHSVALVEPAMSIATWLGMKDRTEEMTA